MHNLQHLGRENVASVIPYRSRVAREIFPAAFCLRAPPRLSGSGSFHNQLVEFRHDTPAFHRRGCTRIEARALRKFLPGNQLPLPAPPGERNERYRGSLSRRKTQSPETPFDRDVPERSVLTAE